MLFDLPALRRAFCSGHVHVCGCVCGWSFLFQHFVFVNVLGWSRFGYSSEAPQCLATHGDSCARRRSTRACSRGCRRSTSRHGRASDAIASSSICPQHGASRDPLTPSSTSHELSLLGSASKVTSFATLAPAPCVHMATRYHMWRCRSCHLGDIS